MSWYVVGIEPSTLQHVDNRFADSGCPGSVINCIVFRVVRKAVAKIDSRQKKNPEIPYMKFSVKFLETLGFIGVKQQTLYPKTCVVW